MDGQLLPFITQIEDNHGDAPSQLAAVQLLDKVDAERESEFLFIGVEGAWGPLDLNPLAALPAGEWRNQWLNRLLWRGDLTGEEYWILSRSPSRVSLIGIDDPALFERHEEARRNVETSRKETEIFLLDLATRVDRLKQHLFPPSWVVMDKALSNYDEGSISINKLSVSISEKVSPHWMKENTPRLFYLAQIHKNPVDPKSVQKELQDMLSFTLTPAESQQLLSGSPMKNLDGFFKDIFAVADARKITLPHTMEYAQQSLWSRNIEPIALSKEVDAVRRSLLTSSPSHPSASKLIEIKETLFLLRGIVALGLTPDDWIRFQKHADFNGIQKLCESIKELESNNLSWKPVGPIPFSYTYVIENAKRFYEIAKLRDHAMAGNLIQQARRAGATRSVVIAGGFHTPGMIHLFRQWGAPFEVLCPIPERKISPTLRAMDAFQQPETKIRILIDTANELKKQEQNLLQAWIDKLGAHDQNILRKAGFGQPQVFRVYWKSLIKAIVRWSISLAHFLKNQWDFFQLLHRAEERTAWATLTTPISPVMRLIPPSIHQTPAEHTPPLPQRNSGEQMANEFQSLVQNSRWVEAENFLWKLWTGYGSARLIGKAFMDLELPRMAPQQARDQAASHLSPQALGLLGQGLLDYYQDRDLERLFERRRLKQTLLEHLQANERNPAEARNEIKQTLSLIHQSLRDEISALFGVDAEGTPGFSLMDPMDPDTLSVLANVRGNGEATARLAARVQNLLDQMNTETGPKNLQDSTYDILDDLNLYLKIFIKKILSPTTTDFFDPAGQARAKLSAYREWGRLTKSLDPAKREVAKRAWRSAETLSRSVVKEELVDPTAYSPGPPPSAYGQVADNQTALRQTLATFRSSKKPIITVSLPYEEAKTALYHDMASALTTSPLAMPGPRRLLRVRLSQLGSTPQTRAVALKELVKRAGELGGTALAIDLDEWAPLLGNIAKPMEHLLLIWAGLESPPPLLLVSASRAHKDLLNTGNFDKSPVVVFPPNRESVRVLLQGETERIQTTSSCEIRPEAVKRLENAVFSTGTVDFSEALKSLRWAAANALIQSAAEGSPPVVTADDLPLQEDAPLRGLPLARQVRIVIGRVDDVFAQALNDLLANFESLSPNSPFYSGVEARLRHAIGLWHMFPKNDNNSTEGRLTQEAMDTGVNIAWAFFNAHLMGLERQKKAVIDTYIKHDLEQQGKHPHAPSDILCLIGPHGTGKTQISTLLAQYTKRKLVKIDAGGASSEEKILGTMSTFVGSQPGKIDLALEDGSDELLILIDEIDKASPQFWNALIQLLEKDQPLDSRYHNFKVPKRGISIITTGNDWGPIPDALKSRLKRTDFSEFSPSELKKTAAQFTWPKVSKQFNFPETMVRCEDPYKIISLLVDNDLAQPALRELERLITRVHRAALLAAMEAGSDALPIIIDEAFVRELMGTPVQQLHPMVRGDTPGQIFGVGVLGTGEGQILPIQAIALPLDQVPGKPLIMTGSAAETMQASGLNAMEALRGRSERYPLDFKNSLPLPELRVHVHLPPLNFDKDGPSAGVPIAVAVYSEITQRQVNPAMAFTGALLPNGQISPVGGISEKIQAARLAGLSTIFIPSGNENDLKAYLESQNHGSEPVAIVSGVETTCYFSERADPRNPHAMTVVPGGFYLSQKDSSNLPANRQPQTTVVLVKKLDEVLDYPNTLLPRGTIIPPPQRREASPTPVPILSKPNAPPKTTAPLGESQTSTISAKPIPSITSHPNGVIPKNVYNRSAATPLGMGSEMPLTPQDFLKMDDDEKQLQFLEKLLRSESTEALALFEALTRALWVLNPKRAGAIFKALFNDLETRSFIFPTNAGKESGGLGIPFLAHMAAAQDNVETALFVYRTKRVIADLEIKIHRITGIETDLKHLNFIPEDLKKAEDRLKSLQHELSNKNPKDGTNDKIVNLYWQNRKEQLTSLSNQMRDYQIMVEKDSKTADPSLADAQKKAYLSLLRSALNFKNEERRHLEEHLTLLINGSERHPLLKSKGENSLTEMLNQVFDQLTRRTTRFDQELGIEAHRLANIQLNLARLVTPIMGQYIKDHSSHFPPLPPGSTPDEFTQWGKPLAPAVAKTLSSVGNRVLTVVCPSEQRRTELPDLIAAHLRESADLPLSAKSYRVLSLNVSKNFTTHAGPDFELMEPLLSHIRESESAVLYIDLTALKAWAGSDYFVVMKRLLRMATENSLHAPLPLVFGTDRETHTQTENTIDRYGANTRPLLLPDPTAGEISSVLNRRARALIDSGSPVRFASSLWETGLADGRLPLDLDQCLTLFDQSAALMVQEERKDPVDPAFLDNIIKKRAHQERAVESIINRAEKEIPKIPDPIAKRRGEEFLARLKTLNSSDAEAVIVSNYLEWLLKWEWNPIPSEKPSLEDIQKLKTRAEKILNKRIYGQHPLKRRILEMYTDYLWQQHLGQNPKMPVIALTGPYGSGKTTVGSVIAEVFNVVFKKFNMAAEDDPRRIRGFEHYIVDGTPGIIFQLYTEAVQQAKMEQGDIKKTPGEIHAPGKAVVMLDEADKAAPIVLNAMYPYLDWEQRKSVDEDFFGFPWNFENVMFISTMNNPEALLPSLRDRMEEIHVPLLEDEEKVGLASDMLLDRIAVDKGIVLTDGQDPVGVKDSLSARVLDFGSTQEKAELFRELIDGWVGNGGAREVGRAVSFLLTSALEQNSKIASQAGYKNVAPLKVRKEDLTNLLGSRRYGDPRNRGLSPTTIPGETIFYGGSSAPGGISIWNRETADEPPQFQWSRGEIEEIGASPGEKRSVKKIKEMLDLVWTVAQKRFPNRLAGNRFLVEIQGSPSGQSGDEALAAYAALASRAFNRAIGKETAFLGEIEATGKIREVGPDIERRLRRARVDGITQFHLNARKDDILNLMSKHPRLAGLILHGSQVSLCLPTQPSPNTTNEEAPEGETYSKKSIQSPLPGTLANTIWSKKVRKTILKSAQDNKYPSRESGTKGVYEIIVPEIADALKLLSEAGISEDETPRFFLSNSVDEVSTYFGFSPDASSGDRSQQKGYTLVAMLAFTIVVGLLGFAFLGEATTAISFAGMNVPGSVQWGEVIPMAKSFGALGFPLLFLSVYTRFSPSTSKGDQGEKPSLTALLAFSEGLGEPAQTSLRNILTKNGLNRKFRSTEHFRPGGLENSVPNPVDGRPVPTGESRLIDVSLESLSTAEIETFRRTATTSLPEVRVPSLIDWLNSRNEILKVCNSELNRRGISSQSIPDDPTSNLIPPAASYRSNPSRQIYILREIANQL